MALAGQTMNTIIERNKAKMAKYKKDATETVWLFNSIFVLRSDRFVAASFNSNWILFIWIVPRSHKKAIRQQYTDTHVDHEKNFGICKGIEVFQKFCLNLHL